MLKNKALANKQTHTPQTHRHTLTLVCLCKKFGYQRPLSGLQWLLHVKESRAQVVDLCCGAQAKKGTDCPKDDEVGVNTGRTQREKIIGPGRWEHNSSKKEQLAKMFVVSVPRPETTQPQKNHDRKARKEAGDPWKKLQLQIPASLLSSRKDKQIYGDIMSREGGENLAVATSNEKYSWYKEGLTHAYACMKTPSKNASKMTPKMPQKIPQKQNSLGNFFPPKKR